MTATNARWGRAPTGNGDRGVNWESVSRLSCPTISRCISEPPDRAAHRKQRQHHEVTEQRQHVESSGESVIRRRVGTRWLRTRNHAIVQATRPSPAAPTPAEAQQRHQDEVAAPTRRKSPRPSVPRSAGASFQRGADNQSRGDRPHAAQRAGDQRVRGEFHVTAPQAHHDDQRHRHHSSERREGAAPAEKIEPDHQRDIANVGPGSTCPMRGSRGTAPSSATACLRTSTAGSPRAPRRTPARKPRKADKKSSGDAGRGRAVSITT